KTNFIKKYLDISIFKESDSIVFDIDKVPNSKFIKSIGTGEVLKWTNIKKIPLVVKEEDLKLKIIRNSITVEINCKSMQDGYENEKIKIKLSNGRERMGLLKKDNGEIYVEI
ncbi:MAG TPA: flagella basal body P-ring formation protein FlgA, partial [Spirochaetota bacterium]|nr:flagella basal body P-ring formation protein FlgA [Spirochaetota bacterium]